MIVGIGIDSIEISRFSSWHTKSLSSLLRVFSRTEIDYCLSIPAKSAERFAARFAAREALYKALSMDMGNPIPFVSLCRLLDITQDLSGKPCVIVSPELAKKLDLNDQVKIWLSVTHTKITATAIIIVEKP